MKYEVDYSGITDEAAKQQKAIDDIISYQGQEWFDKVTQAARDEPIELQAFANMLDMFAGIEGYPVTAWHNYIYGVK